MQVNQVYRFVQHDQVVAELAAPLDCPPDVLHWAGRAIERDVRTHAQAAPGYLQDALALGREPPAQCVDALTRARMYRQPERSYREHMIDVLGSDAELRP
jgi:hypothetical protein